MQPLPTEPVTFPALCLAGRLPEQQNATVNLDLTHAQVGKCIHGLLLPQIDLTPRKAESSVGGLHHHYLPDLLSRLDNGRASM